MSSSQTSSSSTEGLQAAGRPDPDAPFPGLMDVLCPVSVRLGSGSLSVRSCLALKPHSIVRLQQAVGNDLDLCVHDVVIAHAEVAIVDDSTSIRLTEVVSPGADEVER
jgi:flagellar motor switch/type III secretory pathway protein FliN